MTTINTLDARKKITEALRTAIAALPYENEGRAWQADHNLCMFNDGVYEMAHLEFGISFNVTASLSVSHAIGTMSPTYVVSVSQSSGLRTLSQQQASHDLMGAVLKAAHAVQAVIDGLPTITK